MIQPLTYSNSDDPKVTSWCCKLHEINITQTIETQTHGVDAQISDRDQQVVYTLMSLHQKMDSNQATQIEKEEAKKPGSKHFIADTQNLILNASASLPFENAASAPTAFLQKFLEEKTLARTKIVIQKKLQCERLPSFLIKD